MKKKVLKKKQRIQEAKREYECYLVSIQYDADACSRCPNDLDCYKHFLSGLKRKGGV